MKVFLFWSGDRSRAVAEFLRSWIPMVVQSVEPWMSESDIHPGRRWSHTLASQLEESNVGIVCLTKENINNLWLMFEAGALAKSTENGLLIPLLIGLPEHDLPAPLGMFQAVHLDQSGMLFLMQALAAADKGSRLDSQTLATLFEKLWQPMKDQLTAQLAQVESALHSSASEGRKSDRELLEELVAIAKSSRIPTKQDISEALRAWEERLRAESKRA